MKLRSVKLRNNEIPSSAHAIVVFLNEVAKRKASQLHSFRDGLYYL